MAKKKIDPDMEQGLVDELSSQFHKVNSTASASFLWNSSAQVKDWVSTGDPMLDMAISNNPNGGVPVGRLTEISGGEGAGKTLLASYVLANTQKKGGVAILIDTEHAASMEVMAEVGVDVKKLVYIQAGTTEEVFKAMEAIVSKIQSENSDRLITIVWDSIAATSTAAEVAGTYGDHTIGLQARLIGQGLRKYIPIMNRYNVCLVFVNQLRVKIGQSFGDKYDTPGGKAVPYHASVRIRLTHFKQLKDKQSGLLLGRKVKAEIKKNKVAPPMRTVFFTIKWGDRPGAWIDNTEGIFEAAKAEKIFKTVTAVSYEFQPANGDPIQFTKKMLPSLLQNETFYNEVLEQISKHFIITADNISTDLETSDAHEDEGI